MKKLSKLLSIVLFSVFLISCSDDDNNTINPIVMPEPTGDSFIRVIHSSYDAPAVDVWINDNVAIENLSYGESSGYAKLSADTYNIKVVPTGMTTPVVIEANLKLEKDMDYTVIATGDLANITPVVLSDDRSVSTKAKIRFVHSSPDAPAVDIKVEDGTGPVLFANASFRDYAEYIEVNQGTYNLAVTPAGSEKEVIIYGNVPLMAGNIYTVNAIGTLDPNDDFPFIARTYVDNGDGNNFIDLMSAYSYVKVAHASPDAPSVDLLVNDDLTGSNLPFPMFTNYLKVNSGTQNIKINVSGTTTTVIEGDIRFNADKNYSIYAVDKVSNIAPLILEDDLTSPASGNAHVRFLHLSPDAPAVDITLTDGTVVFGNISFKEYTAFTPLGQGTYDLQVRLAGTNTVVLNLGGIELSGGNIYTVFAKGFVSGSGDSALGAEIAINNQLLSK